MKEQWKDIPKFSDYEISNLGRIRSKKRTKKYKSGRTIKFDSKIKSLRKHPQNNFIMTDLIDDKGKRRTVYPHKLVAEAFIENDKPRKNKIVIHKDGDFNNNRIDNLAWASFSESVRIGFETGKRDNSGLWKKRRAKYGPKGSSKPMGRKDPLGEKDKKEIYRLRKEEEMKLIDLADKFNCSVSHIHKTIVRFEAREEKVQ
ncbi:MAG: NUMOD4 domain-containing protein [Brumimicrobium sp.]|nr:NUMOD4 domain-containing protein [Brumimicrobium sp.]